MKYQHDVWGRNEFFLKISMQACMYIMYIMYYIFI